MVEYATQFHLCMPVCIYEIKCVVRFHALLYSRRILLVFRCSETVSNGVANTKGKNPYESFFIESDCEFELTLND